MLQTGERFSRNRNNQTDFENFLNDLKLPLSGKFRTSDGSIVNEKQGRYRTSTPATEDQNLAFLFSPLSTSFIPVTHEEGLQIRCFLGDPNS